MSTAVKEVKKPIKYDYPTNEYDKVLEPDEDFYRAITIDELRKRVKEDIHQWYKERNESNSITRSTTIS